MLPQLACTVLLPLDFLMMLLWFLVKKSKGVISNFLQVRISSLLIVIVIEPLLQLFIIDFIFFLLFDSPFQLVVRVDVLHSSLALHRFVIRHLTSFTSVSRRFIDSFGCAFALQLFLWLRFWLEVYLNRFAKHLAIKFA